jgi:hypothetical protein
MNENEIQAICESLYTMGWNFQFDWNHPNEKRNQVGLLRARGWWVKSDHPTKSKPAGDSRPYWMAAKMTAEAYL